MGGNSMADTSVVTGDKPDLWHDATSGTRMACVKAFVIAGLAADITAGDRVKSDKSRIEICFCGTGAAHATTSYVRHGVKAKHSMLAMDNSLFPPINKFIVPAYSLISNDISSLKTFAAHKKTHGL